LEVVVSTAKEATSLLAQLRSGNQEVASQLVRLVYPQLRKLARRYMKHERPDHTLQATALVHEAYVRMFGSDPIAWQDRARFFAVAAQQMRGILVDHARQLASAKRGAGQVRVSLIDVNGLPEKRDENLVALDDALTGLEALDPRACRVIELRFFGGLTEKEAAKVLSVSVSTVRRDWEFARAWLFDRLSRGQAACSPAKPGNT
jgi:RNA polymerase sigma factor (TIGR02999 family)